MNDNFVTIYYSDGNAFDLNRLICDPLLPADLIESVQTLNLSRQKERLLSRLLLAHHLKKYYAMDKLPDIETSNNGRPTFKDANLPQFNISHSGHTVVVAIATASSIGCDVEIIRERKNYLAIAQNLFSQEEVNWLEQHPNSLDEFWKLWTLREAALKLYADGVWQMRSLTIDPIHLTVQSNSTRHYYLHHQTLNYCHLSIATDTPIKDLTLTEINPFDLVI